MCPITADLTTSQKESIESFEVKETTCIQSFEVNKVEEESDSDYTDGEVICHGDDSNMQFRHSECIMSVEDWEKYDAVDKIRLLMWNPENLAQRLNFDSTTARGKQNRTNSPPLRSVQKEWIEQILAVKPNFIIYNEASLPGGDTQKRKNHVKVTQEAEDFHVALGYQLIIGFNPNGHASHGGAIAVKEGAIITDVKYSFTGGREDQGRVLCVRVQTEKEGTVLEVKMGCG